MNLTVVDLTGTGAEKGDTVTVLSSETPAMNDVYAHAEAAGTIPYETTVRWSDTIRRRITE